MTNPRTHSKALEINEDTAPVSDAILASGLFLALVLMVFVSFPLAAAVVFFTLAFDQYKGSKFINNGAKL